ncbi:alpha/beta hydrolase family protein [Paucibacter sp. XJ19-41]|uniref:alpha/beta hydrolase family protein n=1 Tax=Paucibacter sp. XJ19-41 TaxID=2927824 RepID=UPI00234A1F70|nr:alpha/beta hydrolase [Paucibacter sp. XJ19-41]MDC6170502.1 alpha/beta hydrolase [Paucibacter sp. XJ19-41]
MTTSAAALLLLTSLAALSSTKALAACPAGIYGEATHERVVVTDTPQGATAQRYVFVDGRRGGVGAADALLRCTAEGLQVRSGGSGAEDWQTWPRIDYRQTALRFKSQGSELAGMLIEPPDAATTRPPLTVHVHGSEKTAALGSAYPYLLASQGMSVFVYDKRGTGSSEGQYTQNFELLAEDAMAAAAEARRLAAGRYGRFGYAGFSQGGWVAPLAARRSGADYVVVGFGLMLSPLEEDRDQVMAELREAGYGPATLAKARELTEATGALVASHFSSGYQRLATLKRRYAKEPWLAQIKGEFTGALLASDEATLRRLGPALHDNLGLIWHYDAMRELRALQAPLLWIMAGADREAPGEVTRERLSRLKREGKTIHLYLFPDTDHGMWEFTQATDGSRRYTQVTEGYYRLIGDWVMGRRSAPYGRGQQLF